MAEEPSFPDLIRRLESKDAFERREAQHELARRTHQDLGYRWNDPEPDRAGAVARWRAWWKSRRAGPKRSRSGSGKTVSLQGAVLGLEQLKHALKGIPPDQLEAHLSEILKKMQDAEAKRRICEACEDRPATVHVTEMGPAGTLIHRDLCERCAKGQQELPG